MDNETHKPLDLVEQIWDSIYEDQEQFELTDAQKAAFDRRLTAHAAAPDRGFCGRKSRPRCWASNFDASHIGRFPGRTGAGRGIGPGRCRGRSLPGSRRNHPPRRPAGRPGVALPQRQGARYSAADEPPGHRVADLPGLGCRDDRGSGRPHRSLAEFQRRRRLAGKAPLRLPKRRRRESLPPIA